MGNWWIPCLWGCRSKRRSGGSRRRFFFWIGELVNPKERFKETLQLFRCNQSSDRKFLFFREKAIQCIQNFLGALRRSCIS